MSEPVILAETPRWLVIDKPAGWLSIAGRAEAPVVADWARSRFGEIWIVHRLDRETSGVLLLARTPEAHREAGLWFQRHQVKKIYTCLAVGRPPAPVFKVNKPIGEAASVTQFEIKERFKTKSGAAFLALARPLSGRRHQIRIHLSSGNVGQGYPLLGDARYGGPKEIMMSGEVALTIPRVALHASLLELPGGEVFKAELPEDFQSWLDALRCSTQSSQHDL